MRHKHFTRAERNAYTRSNQLLSVDLRVTPSMRQKVDDLALWLAEGDRSKMRATTKSVIDLLCAAAHATPRRSVRRLAPATN